MISKHVAYDSGHDDYRALARYIADAGHDGEKCLAHWCAGCAADDDYELAIVEAQAVQALNTRSGKEKTYHLLISFRPEDEAALTPETFKAIEERFAAALGFAEHQRHCGIHKNTNNIHMHIAYNMIHAERHTRHEPFRDYAARDKLCRELEREYGLHVDNGREQRRENTLSQKAAAIEAQTGQESFENYAKRSAREAATDLAQARNWQELHEGLRAFSLGIKPHGNGLVLFNLHGKEAVKASSVDRALSAKHLTERFGEFRPWRSLRQIAERSRYEARPLHRGPERGQLFASFKAGIAQRKERLEVVKAREDAALAAIRRQWEAKRREIEENTSLLKRNRRNLLALARKHEAEALAKARLETQPERDKVRQDIPFTSWSGFLRHEAEQGNETALAVLRSRSEAVEPEPAPAHDANRAAALSMRADFATQERALLEREDLSTRGKRQLQAYLRMERALTEMQAEMRTEARAQGSDPGPVSRRVDSKGTVIFTLPSGGTIRDTGKELFFSPHDGNAQELAGRYAALKWGKQIHRDKGHIKFQ